MKHFADAAAIAVAVVLLAASAGKLRRISVFREQVADYQLLPYSISGIVAVVVVAMEIAGACLLVVAQTRLLGAILSTALLSGFLTALVVVWRRGQHIDCGCLGARGEEPIGPATVARTAALLGLAAIAGTGNGESGALDLLLAVLELGLVFVSIEVIRLATELRESARVMEAALLGRLEDRMVRGLRDGSAST